MPRRTPGNRTFSAHGRASAPWARAALFLVAACGRRCGPQSQTADDAGVPVLAASIEVPDADAGRTPESVVEARLDAELAGRAPWGNDVKTATCGTRKDCVVLREKRAGRGPGGDELSVVTVRTMEPNSDDPARMEQRDQWVVGRRAGRLSYRARVAHEWVTENRPIDETLTIGANELETEVNFWPTSTWHSWPHRKFRASPPMLLSFSNTPMHTSGSPMAGGSNTIDFEDGSARGDFSCASRHGNYTPIPWVARAKDLAPASGLGQCASLVDGTTNHGWTAKGKADRASAHFKVAYFNVEKTGPYDTDWKRALFIEVHDDVWTARDALEIRHGRPTGFMRCDNPSVPAKLHRIDKDGKTMPADLAVTLLHAAGDVRMFRIDGDDELRDVAIAQEDDDGTGVVRIIGTTPPFTVELGMLAEVQDVECADTTLGPVLVP